MNTRHVIVVLLCSLSLSLASSGQHSALSREKVVDEVSRESDSGHTSQSLLVVDRDDNITEVVHRQTEPTTQVVQGLGRAVNSSGGLDLSRLLPKGKVASAARRITVQGSIRWHAIVAWGFDKGSPISKPMYSVYVVREDMQRRTASLSYLEEYINPILEQFQFVDLGGDGLPEIIDTGREGSAETRIRRINQDGSVDLVQRFEGYDIEVDISPLGPNTVSIFTRARQENVTDLCLRQETFRWSDAEKKFVKME